MATSSRLNSTKRHHVFSWFTFLFSLAIVAVYSRQDVEAQFGVTLRRTMPIQRRVLADEPEAEVPEFVRRAREMKEKQSYGRRRALESNTNELYSGEDGADGTQQEWMSKLSGMRSRNFGGLRG